MKEFTIIVNDFLKEKSVRGFYDRSYVGYNKPGNPDFINCLKNTFDNELFENLASAQKEIELILQNALPEIANQMMLNEVVVVCVPRSKSEQSYKSSQQMFREAVSNVAKNLSGFVDGTSSIIRKKSTRTTHLKYHDTNGSMPYHGITRDTCDFVENNIKGNHIILVDDIYTKSVNIDEDCLQSLFDIGAKDICFFAIAKTERGA